MASPALFQPFFAEPSWDLWRTILKATFGEALNDAEQVAFRKVTDRSPPHQRVKKAVYIVGRGGGKDSVASVIATHIAISFDRRGRLRPGEKASVMCIACDRTQARIVLNYIKAFFELVPALAAMVVDARGDFIELNNGVVIEVNTNSFRSVRGRSILAAIFDEVAFWRDENSATPDVEVHGAVSPGLARVAGSMLVLISSAHKRAGLLYQLWREYYGRDDEDVLVVQGQTLDFNPTFDASVIAKDLERDPQLYGAEYLSRWRDDLAAFISRELIESAVDRGVVVRPPTTSHRYAAFCDPSGGVNDSFTMAIAHREKDTPMLDLLYERAAPFNPSEVVKDIAEVLKSYGLHQVTGDRYAANWPIEAFTKRGIRYIQSERDRSQIYLDALPLFTSGRVRLIDKPKLVTQFFALERRTFANGRDRVDHPTAGHDDACNAAAGALVLADSKGLGFTISEEALRRSARPGRATASAPIPSFFPGRSF